MGSVLTGVRTKTLMVQPSYLPYRQWEPLGGCKQRNDQGREDLSQSMPHSCSHNGRRQRALLGQRLRPSHERDRVQRQCRDSWRGQQGPLSPPQAGQSQAVQQPKWSHFDNACAMGSPFS